MNNNKKLPWTVEKMENNFFHKIIDFNDGMVASGMTLEEATFIVSSMNIQDQLIGEVQTLIDVAEKGTETPEDLEVIIKYSKVVLAVAKEIK